MQKYLFELFALTGGGDTKNWVQVLSECANSQTWEKGLVPEPPGEISTT